MNKIKILNILPVVYSEELAGEVNDRMRLQEMIVKETNDLVTLDTVFVEKGATSIEGDYDVSMAIPYIVKIAREGQARGYDAIVLDCFMDPGIDACREVVDIPVFGVCQSGCSLAVRMAGEYSVIGILDDMDRCIKQNLAKYGLLDELKSIPVVNVPVLGIHENSEDTIDRIVEKAEEAILQDKAKAIVFGCTGLAPLTQSVKERLKDKGYPSIPVIEPFRAALYDAVACVLMGVSHSKLAYMSVREKIREYDWEK